MTTNTDLHRLAKAFNIPLNAVVSKDHLREMTPQPGGYIVNMEDSTAGNGSHWVAVYFEGPGYVPLYFDSFGIDPPLAIIDFMKKCHNKCIFSTKEIQNINSGFCGQYCLYFLNEMSKNGGNLCKRYQRFLSFFNDNFKHMS